MGFGYVNNKKRRFVFQLIVDLLQVTDLATKWWSGVAAKYEHQRSVAIGAQVDRVVRGKLSQFEGGHGVADVQTLSPAISTNRRQRRFTSSGVYFAANVLEVALVDQRTLIDGVDVGH
jgi:hypothetical protein